METPNLIFPKFHALGESRGDPEGSSPPSRGAAFMDGWRPHKAGRFRTSPDTGWVGSGEIQTTHEQTLPLDLAQVGAEDGREPWVIAGVAPAPQACALAVSQLIFGSHFAQSLGFPFARTSPWYLCAVLCCVFIFIPSPVYKMAVIGAANQGLSLIHI